MPLVAGQLACSLALSKGRWAEVAGIGRGAAEKHVEMDVASCHVVTKRGR